MTLDAVSAAKLNRDGLPRSLPRQQFLGLKIRWLSSTHALKVGRQIADCRLPNPFDIASRSLAEAKIGVVGPVNLVVPTSKAWPGEVGNLVVFKPRRRQDIHRPSVEG